MDHILEFVWHILVVQESSPAYESGLESDTDYIVGCPETIFFHHESLYSLIESNINKELKLYVYSKKTDSVRSLILKPRYGWKNGDPNNKKDGFLGCDIAYGLNHRLPPPQSSTDITNQSDDKNINDEQSSNNNNNNSDEKVPLFKIDEDGHSPLLKSKSQSKLTSSSPRLSNVHSPIRPVISMPYVHTPKTPPPLLIYDNSDHFQQSPLPLELLDSFD